MQRNCAEKKNSGWPRRECCLIDALELGIAMKKKFGVTISPDTENVKQYFQSVAALMKFVEMQRAGNEEAK